MSSSNCCSLICIQISLEADQVVWYSQVLKNFPQFTVIHTVKGFGLVNKAELRSRAFLSSQYYWLKTRDINSNVSSLSVQYFIHQLHYISYCYLLKWINLQNSEIHYFPLTSQSNTDIAEWTSFLSVVIRWSMLFPTWLLSLFWKFSLFHPATREKNKKYHLWEIFMGWTWKCWTLLSIIFHLST